MRMPNKFFLHQAFFVKTCVLPGLQFDGSSGLTWTWRWYRVLDLLLCSYLWWTCLGNFKCNWKPSPQSIMKRLHWESKKKIKNTKKQRLETTESSFECSWAIFINFLFYIRIWCPRTGFGHIKNTKRGLDDIEKSREGYGVPNATGKAFDDLSKLSCILEKQENFRILK